MLKWIDLKVKLNPNANAYIKCEEQWETFIVILKSTKNEIKNTVKYYNTNLKVLAIVSLTSGQYIDHAYDIITHILYQKDSTLDTFYYTSAKVAFDTCYTPGTRYNNIRSEYDANGILICQNTYCEKEQKQLYFTSDCILEQCFKSKQFHGLQLCTWKNQDMSFLHFENNKKHGDYLYQSKNMLIIGQFEDDKPVGIWTKNNNKIITINILLNKHWRFIYENFL